MDHGKGHGKRQHDLLLMLIITSTIEKMMNFARNGVILHQPMALHLIWLWKPKINKANLVSDVHSTHRQALILISYNINILLNCNKQACEQLNAWMGGYESMLKKMTPGNFNWFLHSMLFYHTRHVIAKQEEKASRIINTDGDGDGDGDDDDDYM